VNCLWFLNFNDAPWTLDNYFKFRRISGQTFSEILRISAKDWQLSLQFSNFCRFLVSGSLRNAASGVNISQRIVDWQLSP
jgi:TolB-like protein